MIYTILGGHDSCYIAQAVYIVPSAIYNILGEQDNFSITQTVCLVPPLI